MTDETEGDKKREPMPARTVNLLVQSNSYRVKRISEAPTNERLQTCPPKDYNEKKNDYTAKRSAMTNLSQRIK